MNKIIIIGCPGAGKTTLATKLGRKLNIPVHHLDKYFWHENWTPTSQDDFKKIQNELMKESRWIIDGNFTSSIDHRIANADTVVFLDFSKIVIFWRVFKRYVAHFGKVRHDMGGGNKEAIKWQSIKFILHFPSKEIYSILDKNTDKKIIILHNSKEADSFLQKISL